MKDSQLSHSARLPTERRYARPLEKERASPTKFTHSCKLGTMPALVRVHGRDKIEVGSRIRIQEGPGDNWHTVLVTKVNPDGYFFANR